MKKWMVLVVLGLFLFGCDSDDEEVVADTGCDPTAEDACEEGLACLPVVAEAAEGDAEEAAEGEEAEEADAAEATVTYACQTPVEEEEEEEVVIPTLEPQKVLSTDGEEGDHVAKGCDTFDNSKDGGEPAFGFCYDTGVDTGLCEGELGGTHVSGKCDGKADATCCSAVVCTGYSPEGLKGTGVCLGQVEPNQGDDAPALPACNGTAVMNSDCPNDAEKNEEGNVWCCIAEGDFEEAAEAAAEGEEAAEEGGDTAAE